MGDKNEIKNYYENLAEKYDEKRFGNSYGHYVHQQECRLLDKIIPPSNRQDQNILDLGCGTGRLLKYCSHGMDASISMVEAAMRKHPDKKIKIADIEKTGYPDNFFETILCFHVLMHFSKDAVIRVLTEAHRILKKDGELIFDIPSGKRRSLTNYNAIGWHGACSFTINELKSIVQKDWEIISFAGTLFFPVHRVPSLLRSKLIYLDSLFCKSPLREYSSYLVIRMKKK